MKAGKHSSRTAAKAAAKAERSDKRRRQKVATATGTMLLVAAAVAGEPTGVDPAQAVAAAAGGGLHGMTDPDSVSASGEVGDDDRIGDEVLASAGDIDRLRQMGPTGDLPNGPLMIPSNMYQAYTKAALMLANELPTCKLHWSLLASIGRIESNHARGGQADAAGNTVPQILGPVLNGGGFAAIRDTDGGRLDGDARWDRAVGSMQFIPSTWSGYASDGNGDGVSSPHNIYDASVAAGKYLCSGGMDLSDPRDRATAVFRYNHSDSYVRTVLIWADAYAKGTNPLPSTPVDPGQVAAMRPPVNQNPGSGVGRPGQSNPPNNRPPNNNTPPRPKPPASSTTTSPTCGPTTTTTTTTPPSSPPSTTTTNPCQTSSTPPSSSSSASEGSSSVTPTSAPPSSSSPAGEVGTSVVPTS